MCEMGLAKNYVQQYRTIENRRYILLAYLNEFDSYQFCKVLELILYSLFFMFANRRKPAVPSPCMTGSFLELLALVAAPTTTVATVVPRQLLIPEGFVSS